MSATPPSGEQAAKGTSNPPILPGPTSACCICFDSKHPEEGVECSAASGIRTHYTCNECMDGYIAYVSEAGNVPHEQLAQSDGCVACPIVPCGSSKFSPHTIAAHVTAEVYAAYFAAVMISKEALLIPKLKSDIEARRALRTELEAQNALSTADEAARIAELFFDNILQLKCPCCKCRVL